MSSLEINRRFPKINGKIEINGRFPIDSDLGEKERFNRLRGVYKQENGGKEGRRL